MPQKLDSTHQLIPNKLVIYRRPNSSVWQCRYKVDGKWLVSTTKSNNIAEATQQAHRLLIQAEIRRDANIAVVTKKFRDVARQAIKRMEIEQAGGKAPVSYDQYKRITTEFLIPFFGNKNIDSITFKILEEYAEWRTVQMGKAPAYSTVRKHNVTLNRIFDEAIERGYMTNVSVPKLETKGRKSTNYPSFEVEEVNAVIANFEAWIEAANTDKKKQQRQMLQDYVRVLIDTGARPGKELLDLQWKKIKVKIAVQDDPQRVVNDEGEVEIITHRPDEDGLNELITKTVYTVLMNVSGKTKERTVNGFDETFNVLRGIVDRNYKDQNTSVKKLTDGKSEDYVFRTQEGAMPSSFNHLFERYLSDHNLLLDPSTGRKRVFYSLRSTYATTVMNLDAVPIRDLSKQLGNSVGVIQKHYDRATGEAIVENVRAPNSKKALFDTSNVNDIYKSNKQRKASKAKL